MLKKMISFQDFQKIDLRIAKILSAEKIEGSDKLIVLKIRLKEEERQIVAGIGKEYQPQDLVGKKIVVVANLEPKELMGHKSEGMLLAAVGEDNKPVLIVPEKDVKEGTRVS